MDGAQRRAGTGALLQSALPELDAAERTCGSMPTPRVRASCCAAVQERGAHRTACATAACVLRVSARNLADQDFCRAPRVCPRHLRASSSPTSCQPLGQMGWRFLRQRAIYPAAALAQKQPTTFTHCTRVGQQTHTPAAGMLVVGLSGGIASGKSTVSRLLQRDGLVVIDCDAIAHATSRRGTWGFTRIIQAFGRDVLDPVTGARPQLPSGPAARGTTSSTCLISCHSMHAPPVEQARLTGPGWRGACSTTRRCGDGSTPPRTCPSAWSSSSRYCGTGSCAGGDSGWSRRSRAHPAAAPAVASRVQTLLTYVAQAAGGRGHAAPVRDGAVPLDVATHPRVRRSRDPGARRSSPEGCALV